MYETCQEKRALSVTCEYTFGTGDRGPLEDKDSSFLLSISYLICFFFLPFADIIFYLEYFDEYNAEYYNMSSFLGGCMEYNIQS